VVGVHRGGEKLVLKEHNLCFKVLSDGWAWWFCVTYMSTVES